MVTDSAAARRWAQALEDELSFWRGWLASDNPAVVANRTFRLRAGERELWPPVVEWIAKHFDGVPRVGEQLEAPA